jgi:hypothetical protein
MFDKVQIAEEVESGSHSSEVGRNRLETQKLRVSAKCFTKSRKEGKRRSSVRSGAW